MSMFSQKETNVWYFGYGAGLDFNGGSPVSLLNGNLYTDEGSATICDTSGNLLFYTDGDTIWNKNHQPMLNGTGLCGSTTTTQTIILQVPGSNNLYYTFTRGTCTDGLHYSIVDMNMAGGLGAVTQKNIYLEMFATEKITAVKHCNNKDIWVITSISDLQEGGTSRQAFYAYLLTSSGLITNPVVTNVPLNNPNIAFTGQLKASPNGRYIGWDAMNYANFDNSTGKVSNIKKGSTNFPNNYFGYPEYGIEFSPDSKYIYNEAFQIEVATGNIYFLDTYLGGALQLASDGKIYVGTSVIEQPNLAGAACSLNKNAISLGGKTASSLSFPNYMSSYFYHPTGEFVYTGECAGSIFSFELKNSTGIDSVLWIFHNNTTSKSWTPTFTYSSEGCYKVEAVTYQSGNVDTTSQCVLVKGTYTNFLGNDSTVCSEANISIGVKYPYIGKYLWSTGDTTASLKITQPGKYWVKVTNSCAISSDTIAIKEKSCNTNKPIYAPNVFTPNDDGYNDVFKIELVGGAGIKSLECEIYNRWGEKMATFQGINGSWDGKTKEGLSASDGVYYFVAKYEDQNNKIDFLTGYIQLISN